MIPTHFDHPENLNNPEQEANPPARNTWLALILILAVLAAVIVLLSMVDVGSGEQAATTVPSAVEG